MQRSSIQKELLKLGENLEKMYTCPFVTVSRDTQGVSAGTRGVLVGFVKGHRYKPNIFKIYLGDRPNKTPVIKEFYIYELTITDKDRDFNKDILKALRNKRVG